MKPIISVFCVWLLLLPAGAIAADKPGDPPQGDQTQVEMPSKTGLLGKLDHPYRASHVPPPDLANSPRLESLMRAGNIYLSLQDAIALALEDDLDIAIQRYGPPLADAAILAAEAGSFARGVSTTVTAGPASSSVSASGTTPGVNQNASSLASSATASAVGGTVLQTSGPLIPSLDPMFTGSWSWGHTTTPESSPFITGSTSLIQDQNITNFGIQKGFLTGTILGLGLNNNNTTSNSPRTDFNPATNSSLGISLTQHLLQGFGWAVNSRQIHIARNNREVADLTFKLQVETTVAAVAELYWDLVAFNENVRVAQEEIAAAQRLYEDNKRQVAVGTLAPIEITRAEAQIATGQQALVLAQMQVQQQETIIKTALSRTGVANPEIANAHIVPTDAIRLPDVEPIAPIQDLTSLALSSRPELAQSRIQLHNQDLTIKGSKNALLPTLDAVANLSNNALAGQPSNIPALPGSAHSNNPFFVGGYGTVLQQLFARNFPNYSVGLNLNIPIRNRAAQAQVINDELTLRQQQLGLVRLENQVRVDVQNALISVSTSRAQYEAAVKAQALQAETLDADQKKLAMGVATIYNVIQDQQTLTQANSNVVTAKAAYAKAKVELSRATGQILYDYNISLDEAYKGVVSRPPSPLPSSPPPAAQVEQR